MNKNNSKSFLLNKIFHKAAVLPCTVFVIISTVYFSSAVGLMNTMDAPQYFTTEALLKYGNLDLAPFRSDPHYFVNPDFFYYRGQILGVRGYLLSLFTVPLHTISSYWENFYQTGLFPKQVAVVTNFKYELSIVSFFIFFSSIGLLVFWKLQEQLTHNRFIASLLTLAVAFGSYIWKYSASYARHGFEVLLLSSSCYCIFKIFKNQNNVLWWMLFFLIWSVSFGIDPFLFLAMSVYILFFSISIIVRNKLTKLIDPKKVLLILLPALTIIALNIIGNYYWYGTWYTSQTHELPIIKNAGVTNNLLQVWMSTPLYPTILTVLFSCGKIPESAFLNFTKLPPAVSFYSSVSYAKQFNFYGLFTISPFIFVVLFSLLKLNKPQRELGKYCLTVFIIGILINTKKLGFWAGNQYDVRYFYPYLLLPASFCGIGFKNLLKKQSNILILLFLVLAAFSLVMGWLGVISMFKPALLGERRVWVDLHNLPFLSGYSYKELIDATFMNRQNAWIGLISAICLYIIYLVIRQLISKIILIKKIKI